MNKLKFDLMESLVKIKDIESLNQSIINMGKELIDEGFDEEDVVEFIKIKVNKCLESQTNKDNKIIQRERGEIKNPLSNHVRF